jgi:hypothetical protein
MQEYMHVPKEAKRTENRRNRNKEWREKKEHNKTKEEVYRNVTILKKLDITSDMVTNASCRAFGIPEEGLLHFFCPSDSPTLCIHKINTFK